MTCCDGPLLGQLQGVLNDLQGLSCNIGGGGSCGQPCCPPSVEVPPVPHPICCHPCPPPLVLPTLPEPVKPLMLPIEKCENRMSDEEQYNYKLSNFYNNYGIDWRAESIKPCGPPAPDPRAELKNKVGVTVDGKRPYCPRCPKTDCCTDKGCPTGFKPCVMKMTPPRNGHPCGLWCAEVQECPPKMTGRVNCQRPAPPGCTICHMHCDPRKCNNMCFNR